MVQIRSRPRPRKFQETFASRRKGPGNWRLEWTLCWVAAGTQIRNVSGERVYALHHYTLIQSDKIHPVWR